MLAAKTQHLVKYVPWDGRLGRVTLAQALLSSLIHPPGQFWFSGIPGAPRCTAHFCSRRRTFCYPLGKAGGAGGVLNHSRSCLGRPRDRRSRSRVGQRRGAWGALALLLRAGRSFAPASRRPRLAARMRPAGCLWVGRAIRRSRGEATNKLDPSRVAPPRWRCRVAGVLGAARRGSLTVERKGTFTTDTGSLLRMVCFVSDLFQTVVYGVSRVSVSRVLLPRSVGSQSSYAYHDRTLVL